jgi:hypothetical protein
MQASLCSLGVFLPGPAFPWDREIEEARKRMAR